MKECDNMNVILWKNVIIWKSVIFQWIL